jgi:hypothetical protein
LAGNADDASGNGNHGTPSGAVLTSDPFGAPDEAYEFDGNDDVIAPPDDPSLDLTQPLLIGTRLQLPADTFRGALDDIAVYDRALTASEVMNFHALPPVSVETASWSGTKASYR